MTSQNLASLSGKYYQISKMFQTKKTQLLHTKILPKPLILHFRIWIDDSKMVLHSIIQPFFKNHA
jgi:hypothetical protein